MDYTRPTIVDYGDVAQLTAQLNFKDIGDANFQTGETLGIQNSTGQCNTGQQNVGGVCVPLP
jgi:hypothetical protein